MATHGNTSSPSAMSTLMGVMTTAKEKWDASGANEAIARASASLPQGTQEYLSSTSQQLFNRQKLRNITVFFGMGEERPFYVEKAPSLLLTRVQHNLTFFFLNYMVITGMLFCLTLLISPSAIIGIGLLGGLWFYVVRSTQDGPMVVYGFSISQTNATITLGIFSFIVLIWLLSGIFWWTLASSGFLVGAHAVLRDASMHQDNEDKVDMVGEVTGESAAFLGQSAGVHHV